VNSSGGETREDPSGWTTDTLRMYVQTQLDQLNELLVERFQAQQQAMQVAFAAAETATVRSIEGVDKQVDQRFVATIRTFEIQIADLKVMLNERYATQVKAVDAAFLAQQTAMQCVSADTPVLGADLVWRPAGDLMIGDELVAFDEGSHEKAGRRFRKATVTGNSLRRDALLRVTTPVGSVRCNYAHPWLARRKEGHDRWNMWRWIRAEELRPGDEVVHALDVGQSDRTWDGGWLGGMYDGEGSIRITPTGVRLYLTQQEGPLADRVHAALKDRLGHDPIVHRTAAGRYQNTRAVHHYIVGQRADVLKMVGAVRPHRLLARSDEMWVGRRLGGRHRTAVVTAVEGAGTGVIASLSTSTGTYLAAGFAMHNTALTAAETAVSKALESAEKAAIKAETASDKRFESVNEFRAQLADQAQRFMPRTESEAATDRNTERVQEMANEVSKMITRTETVAYAERNAERIQELSSRVSAMAGQMVDPQAFAELTKRIDQSTGKGEGASALWGYILGGIGMVVAVIAVIVALSNARTANAGLGDPPPPASLSAVYTASDVGG